MTGRPILTGRSDAAGAVVVTLFGPGCFRLLVNFCDTSVWKTYRWIANGRLLRLEDFFYGLHKAGDINCILQNPGKTDPKHQQPQKTLESQRQAEPVTSCFQPQFVVCHFLKRSSTSGYWPKILGKYHVVLRCFEMF